MNPEIMGVITSQHAWSEEDVAWLRNTTAWMREPLPWHRIWLQRIKNVIARLRWRIHVLRHPWVIE